MGAVAAQYTPLLHLQPMPARFPAVPEGLNPAGRLPWLALLVALAWAPWPLGSNRPWALALLAGLLCVATLGLGQVGWARLAHRLERARWALLALLGLAALVVLQLLLNRPPLFTLDAFASRQYLLRTLAYTAAFALVVGLAHTEQRVRTLLTLLLAGEDTTANTLAWMIWLLSRHPEALARAQAYEDAGADVLFVESPESQQEMQRIMRSLGVGTRDDAVAEARRQGLLEASS